MATRASPPLESFGPEILSALIAGATKEFTFETTYKHAVKFRQRVHQLRSKMREERHLKYDLVARAKVTIQWGPEINFPEVEENINSKKVRTPKDPNTKVRLTIAPQDAEFTQALEKAGIKIENMEDVLDTPQPEQPSPTLEEILRDSIIPASEKND